MRYLKLPAIILLATAAAVAQSSAPPSQQEIAELKRLEPQRAAEGLQFLTSTRERYGLDSRHTFRHVNSLTDDLGVFHGRYRQYFNGVRVGGGNAIVHIGRNGHVERPTTKLYNTISVPTTPAISEREAIAAAIAAMNPSARLTGLETSEVELIVHLETTLVDRGEPSRYQLASNPRHRRYQEVVRSERLVWHVLVSSDDSPLEPRILLIDANNGSVVKSFDPDDHEQASGIGFFSGPQVFHTTKSGNNFLAIDPNRGSDGGNVFLNANHGTKTSYKHYGNYQDADNFWGNGQFDNGTFDTNSPTSQSAYVDAQLSVSKAWDLLGLYGRKGWDNDGSRVIVRMHYGVNYNDAKFATGGLAKNRGMFLGNGGISFALRTVAHELGHGFFHSIYGWSYKPDQEWAGINEGNSDVFGSLTELFTYKAPGETKRFTDMEGEWRWHARMIDPLGYDAPDKTIGYRYWQANLGDKEEHTVGCLFGHLFIFLADGASSDPASTLYSMHLPNGMSGIGVEKAAGYWFRAMTAYMPVKGDYFDLREAFLDAASNPFNPQSDRAAISAAFAGIGVGGLTENGPDSQDPDIQALNFLRLDELAGFLEVDVDVFDLNMARVEVLLDGKLMFTDYRLPYGGPVDLTGVAPGTHFITVRAYDIYGRSSSKMRSFSIKGTRNLIVDGGFEEQKAWAGTSGQTTTSPDLAFAGTRYARMRTNGAIWQDVTIPADAVNVRLRYRVRAENHSETGYQDSRLEVRLLNPTNNGLITHLATHQEGVETFENALTKTYQQMALAIDHRGAARVHFLMLGSGNVHRFKVDNIALTYDIPTSAQVKAIVRNGEDTVEFSTTLTGFDIASIKSVQYFIDDAYQQGGQPAIIAHTGPDFRAILPTGNLSKKTHTVIASVRFKNDTEAAKAGVYFTIANVNDRIQNGDFAQGLNHWPVTGGASTTQKAMDLPSPCFLDDRCALLGAIVAFPTSTMSQYFNMPPFPESATLTYRLRVKTTEPGAAVDTFRVYIVDGDNKKWLIGSTYSNATDTGIPGSPDSYLGWLLVENSLPQGLLKGGDLKLVLESQQNNVNRTDFLVDNVSLVVKTKDVKLQN